MGVEENVRKQFGQLLLLGKTVLGGSSSVSCTARYFGGYSTDKILRLGG